MTNEQKAKKLLDKALKTRNTKYIIVKKRFPFTMEQFQDNPEDIKRQLLEYLTEHSDIISKVEIEVDYDENTFAPWVTLRLHTEFTPSINDCLTKL